MNCEERSQIYVFFSIHQQEIARLLFNVLFIWFVLDQSHQIKYQKQNIPAHQSAEMHICK